MKAMGGVVRRRCRWWAVAFVWCVACAGHAPTPMPEAAAVRSTEERLASDVDGPSVPSPTAAAVPDVLGRACDDAERLVRGALKVEPMRVDAAVFMNEFVKLERRGCRIAAEGTFGSREGDAGGDLAQAFHAAGWEDAYGYAADGPDGSVFGVRAGGVLCIATMAWDGGDDSDPDYVPDDWFTVEVACATGVPEDVIEP